MYNATSLVFLLSTEDLTNNISSDQTCDVTYTKNNIYNLQSILSTDPLTFQGLSSP